MRAETHGEEERQCNLESCVSGLTGPFSGKLIGLVYSCFSLTHIRENLLSAVLDVFLLLAFLGLINSNTAPLCLYVDIACVCLCVCAWLHSRRLPLCRTCTIPLINLLHHQPSSIKGWAANGGQITHLNVASSWEHAAASGSNEALSLLSRPLSLFHTHIHEVWCYAGMC